MSQHEMYYKYVPFILQPCQTFVSLIRTVEMNWSAPTDLHPEYGNAVLLKTSLYKLIRLLFF